MTAAYRVLLFAVERTYPAPYGAHIVGDLHEEASGLRRAKGPLHAASWLTWHALRCCFEGARLRAGRADILELTAATALLFVTPIVLALALRRFVLTQVPLRESADLAAAPFAALAVFAAALAFAEARLLGRRAAAATLCLLAAAAIPRFLDLPLTALQLAGLLGSVVCGAAAAPRKEDSQ